MGWLRRHGFTCACAGLAALLAWWLAPPRPRWTAPPLFDRPAWAEMFFSADGALVAICQPKDRDHQQRQLRLWRIATGEPVALLHDGPGQLECVAFSPDASTVAAWWHDRRIDVWDLPSGRLSATHRRPQWKEWYPHVQVVYASDGRLLLYGPETTSGKTWDVATGAVAAAWDAQRDCNRWTTRVPGYLIAGSDARIYIWRLADGRLTEIPEGGNNVLVRAAAGDGLIVVHRPRLGEKGLLHFCDTASGQTRVLPFDLNHELLDVSPTGDVAAFGLQQTDPLSSWLEHWTRRPGAQSKRVRFVAVGTGATVATLVGASRARFAPDGRTVVVTSVSGELRAYDWPLRQPLLWIALAGLAGGGVGWLLAAAARRLGRRRATSA